MSFLDNLQKLPAAASPENVKNKIEQWEESAERKGDLEILDFIRKLKDNTAGNALFSAIFGNSPFLTQSVLKQPAFLKKIIENGFDASFDALISDISEKSAALESPDEVMALLRIAKMRVSLLVAIADITNSWPLETVTAKLSYFAESSLKITTNFLLMKAASYQEIEVENIKNPALNSGLIIIGMGKLGARELNYSSDIDIVILFDSEKVKYKGTKNIQAFFIRFAQDLTRIMNDRTKDGYVFRVDLRLRPDPASTPAAMSVRAAEIYYESVGQNWERAVMIKARPVAGDLVSGQEFLDYLKPYIWRKHLDFAAIEDIQSIKRQIDSKHKSETLYGYNIKLGHGGIREIEFFIQTQQLIWGGREPSLRVANTCDALRALANIGKISGVICDNLISSYRFFRDIEHRLQMINDNQTHSLPANEKDFRDFSIFAGFDNVEEFESTVNQKLKLVQNYYRELYDHSKPLASAAMNAKGNLSFTGSENDPETLETITKMGFRDPVIVSETIRGWHHGRRRVTRSKKARELITELTPAILSSLSQTINPDIAFAKFDEFLSRLPDGLQIFSLFQSNPHILELIAEIMGKFPYLAEKLSRKPSLLDYVLSPEFYLDMPDKKEIKEKLKINLKQAHDFQDVLDITRRWAEDRQFRVGVQLAKNKMKFEDSSLHLSNIADASLALLLHYTEKDFAKKHGVVRSSEFAIITMGKLGGHELTFGSDLDLVFIYETEKEDALSTGPQPLQAGEYFLRLSRRFISAISSLTAEGKLYEIDMRLRPSGEDGPIASNIKAFSDYYETSAWTWEYMALTRARVIAGNKAITGRINKIISEKICKMRDIGKLAREVNEMREKISLGKNTTNYLNVKHVRGGLIDVEFIAQFLQLAHAYKFPQIISQNTKQVIKNLHEYKIISAEDFETLVTAASILQDTQCVLRLTGVEIPDENNLTPGMQKELSNILNADDSDGSKYEEFKKTLVSYEEKVQNCFENIICHYEER